MMIERLTQEEREWLEGIASQLETENKMHAAGLVRNYLALIDAYEELKAEKERQARFIYLFTG